MAANRVEKDSMGPIDVPADKLWGRKRSVLWNISVSPRRKCLLNWCMRWR